MESIKVKKAELLETLKVNRHNHRKIFLEAQEGYRKTAITEIEKMLSEAREGKKIRRQLVLSEPVDQTNDYDRVIRMLEMSQDEMVELSEHDFAQYVLDDWSWKRQFLHSNSVYSATAAGLNEF
jgi:hypothetical protein